MLYSLPRPLILFLSFLIQSFNICLLLKLHLFFFLRMQIFLDWKTCNSLERGEFSKISGHFIGPSPWCTAFFVGSFYHVFLIWRKSVYKKEIF